MFDASFRFLFPHCQNHTRFQSGPLLHLYGLTFLPNVASTTRFLFICNNFFFYLWRFIILTK
ncbi:uncharacterized protein DS421_7g214390 [Arachis hypogaea]|nr:uncharacterized protein DS421_7g214390 [Arachis hypogaea]